MDAFGFLRERAQKKLQGWREKTLSNAGKEILLKSVIQSIPTYVMSCFELPKHLCHEIHQLMAKFWWGGKGKERKIHWLAWEKLCAPKSDGGLGFRNLIQFNQALLAKQGWRLLRYPESLVAKVFKAKYFPNSGFLDAKPLSDMSYSWRSILVGKELLLKGIRFQIGSGNSVSLWNDPWLPLPYKFRPFSLPMEGTEDWTVSDVIDQDSKEWIQPIIYELFSSQEADLALRIPLSLGHAEDRFIWHFDRKGLYSVKSGYHVARLTFDHTSRASSSDVNTNVSNPWQSLWKARVPPKVRSFIWRLLRGIVPTRVALAKKISLPDITCVFCKKGVESDVHLFKYCKALTSFWSSSGLSLQREQPGLSIFDWITSKMEVLSGHQIDLFFMHLWVIWTERNNICWNGGAFNPGFMSTWAVSLLEQYQCCHPVIPKSIKRKKMHWVCPPQGRLKINVDGAFIQESLTGGIGVIVRDEKGLCIAAFARSLSYVLSALHAETEACRAGLLIAIHQGWTHIDLESDSSLVLAALSHSTDDYSDVGRIVEDCRKYLSEFNLVTTRHVFREANGVAHRLAHLASRSIINDLWLDETPSIIEDVLYEDLCHCARGFGSSSPSSHTNDFINK